MKQKYLNETASSLDLTKEVQASPRIYIDTSMALADNMSPEVKEKISTINIKDVQDESIKINDVIEDALAIKDTVINSPSPPLKEIPALAPGSTFSVFPEKSPEFNKAFDEVMKSRGSIFDLLLATINPFSVYSTSISDGRRLKGSRRHRKESQKQYKKSIRQQAKQECKRSQRKLKAMLRRSARIQAQAKKLRKSLKKRRCDGTSDLFSSCYVNKTAY
jgi:hypothetical protein